MYRWDSPSVGCFGASGQQPLRRHGAAATCGPSARLADPCHETMGPATQISGHPRCTRCRQVSVPMYLWQQPLEDRSSVGGAIIARSKSRLISSSSSPFVACHQAYRLIRHGRRDPGTKSRQNISGKAGIGLQLCPVLLRKRYNPAKFRRFATETRRAISKSESYCKLGIRLH